MLHETDLFHPPADPDDHWDLACVFALALQERVDLAGVLIDCPSHRWPLGDPAIGAVAQLNRLSGLRVPLVVGSGTPTTHRRDAQPDASPTDRSGPDFVLECLASAEEPVVINIVGSSRDVAIAGAREPALFADRCRAIYLNAGWANADSAEAGETDYNTSLDPHAFATILDLPCTIYWLPCLEALPDRRWHGEVRPHASWYRFQQKEILPSLSAGLQAYFCYALSSESSHRWLMHLNSPPSQEVLEVIGWRGRNMWCTAGFFHAAGQAVDTQGRIVEPDAPNTVFSFVPIDVQCDNDGRTRWKPAGEAGDRYILRIDEIGAYRSAMVAAMRDLLATFP
jgi:hypothetical protein